MYCRFRYNKNICIKIVSFSDLNVEVIAAARSHCSTVKINVYQRQLPLADTRNNLLLNFYHNLSTLLSQCQSKSLTTNLIFIDFIKQVYKTMYTYQ